MPRVPNRKQQAQAPDRVKTKAKGGTRLAGRPTVAQPVQQLQTPRAYIFVDKGKPTLQAAGESLAAHLRLNPKLASAVRVVDRHLSKAEDLALVIEHRALEAGVVVLVTEHGVSRWTRIPSSFEVSSCLCDPSETSND